MFFIGVGWLMLVTVLAVAQIGNSYEINQIDQILLADKMEQDLAGVENASLIPSNLAKVARDLVHTASKLSLHFIKRVCRINSKIILIRLDYIHLLQQDIGTPRLQRVDR